MEENEVEANLKSITDIEISEEKLFAPIDYVDVEAGGEVALLHGQFTADQLESIAHWMRSKDVKTN